MCGITGFIDFNRSSSTQILDQMTFVLSHRGPDDSGIYFEEYDNCQIGLGHRRLSILDLSENGSQPMSFEDLTLVFNGEIYNFEEIREDLINVGYYFSSNSDTEVLLKSYHKWGEDMIKRLNGMFSIVILNKTDRTLTIIRDRSGVKPLYWYYENDVFLFSSELKSFFIHPSFNKKISSEGLELFFKYGYIPQPFSIYQNAYKLKAGYLLKLDLGHKQLQELKYWDINDSYGSQKSKLSTKETLESLEDILISSCKLRMVSDVPIGVFLSGGYDSTAVTSLMQLHENHEVKTFTIGFHEKNYDESNYAKEIANYLKTDHHEMICSIKDAIEMMGSMPSVYDEPFGDPSALPTLLLSKFASKFVKVAISADGGDELFGGYKKYSIIKNSLERNKKIPNYVKAFLQNLQKLNNSEVLLNNRLLKDYENRFYRFCESLDNDEISLLQSGSQIFSNLQLLKLFSSDKIDFSKTEFDNRYNHDFLTNLLIVDFKTYLPDDILVKVDRATMAYGLEGREPLLDYRLIEFMSSVDSNLKHSKFLLKEITHKYVPKYLLDRPKKGFGIPLTSWLKGELKDYLEEYINENQLKKHNLFNIQFVLNLKDEFLLRNNDFVAKNLWLILVFQIWYNKWMLEE